MWSVSARAHGLAPVYGSPGVLHDSIFPGFPRHFSVLPGAAALFNNYLCFPSRPWELDLAHRASSQSAQIKTKPKKYRKRVKQKEKLKTNKNPQDL